MKLPTLPPGITFPQLSICQDDVDFAFEAKWAAMGPHITKRWGWNEVFQRDLHQQRYGEKPFFEIRKDGQRLGVVSFHAQPGHVRFGEFYLFPEHQRRGIGSAILAHCLSVADDLKLPVKLEHLHWSPVGSLYQRHGFVEVGRSDVHCFMERPAARS